ncbi:YjbQ family protein [Nitrospira defluvii]|nr:YjbQ family protein [Nitrospira defluvii]
MLWSYLSFWICAIVSLIRGIVMMNQKRGEISFQTDGRRLYDITQKMGAWVAAAGLSEGLLTLFIRHTSASLMIQENDDPEVLRDMERFFDRLVPQGDPLLRHTAEGPDDMPAHIRAALTEVSLSIPIRDAQPALGTWQGIFLYEHRTKGRLRTVLCQLIGE